MSNNIIYLNRVQVEQEVKEVVTISFIDSNIFSYVQFLFKGREGPPGLQGLRGADGAQGS